MKLFKWQLGRQDTGYWILPLIYSKLFNLDMYILKFEAGTEVPWHTDPSEDGDHYRLNIYLTRPEGGDIKFRGEPIYENDCLHLFRPDIVEHSMTKVNNKTLYILSIGKVI